MSTSLAKTVRFDDRAMWVELHDGRTIEVAFTRFPRLLKATPEQRRQVWIGYEGYGLHWDEIDEDISVEQLLSKGEGVRFLTASVAAE